MNAKKLFAGLAVAATLLSGLALGATSANAADEAAPEAADPAPLTLGKDITVNAADYRSLIKAGDTVAPRDFKAVAIADYVKTPDATDGPSITLKVKDNFKSTIQGALTGYDATKDGDPIAWMTRQPDYKYRSLVTAIENDDAIKGAATEVKPAYTQGTAADADGKTSGSLKFTFAEPGLYLIYDVTDPGVQTFTENGKNVEYPHLVTMLVGTKVSGGDYENALGGNIAAGELETKIKEAEDDLKNFPASFTFSATDGNGATVNSATKADSATFEICYSETSIEDAKACTNYMWMDGSLGHASYGTKDAAAAAKSGVDFQAQDGKYYFSRVKDGYYYVKETSAPKGFLEKYKGEFVFKLDTVASAAEGATKTTNATLFQDVDSYGLATADLLPNSKDTYNADSFKVKNVQNISQLPLTGAAGTILFTAIGALVAALAITMFIKSGASKRMLAR